MNKDRNLWDLTGKRNTLRKIYHHNAMLSEHYYSNRIKPVHKQRDWKVMEAIPLSPFKAETEYEKLLVSRRTRREVSGKKIDMHFISKLLQFCVGITGTTYEGYQLFSYPSPGATYAATVFISIDNGQSRYVYRYNAYDHSLEKFVLDRKNRISHVIIDQSLAKFPIKIFLASDYQLIEDIYGEIAYRLLCLEMGHMAQNISLYSEENNYHSVCMGGYNEILFKELIGKQYDLHYVVVVG